MVTGQVAVAVALFSSDSKTLWFGGPNSGPNGVYEVTDLDHEPRIKVAFPGATGISAAAGGRQLVVAYPDSVRVFDAHTATPIGPAFEARGFYIYAVYSAPRGHQAVISSNQAWRLVDLDHRRLIGPNLAAGALTVAVLGQSGTTVYPVGPNDGRVRWNLAPAHVRAVACGLAGRNLTAQEWDRYLAWTGPRPRDLSPVSAELGVARGMTNTRRHLVAGDGPEVRDPIEAMIVVMADRVVPMSEFHGDGVDLLATRVPPPNACHAAMTGTPPGEIPDLVTTGRAAFAKSDWQAAYDALTRADAITPLAAEDLDRAAEAAMWVGEHQACIEFGLPAFNTWEAEGDVKTRGHRRDVSVPRPRGTAAIGRRRRLVPACAALTRRRRRMFGDRTPHGSGGRDRHVPPQGPRGRREPFRPGVADRARGGRPGPRSDAARDDRHRAGTHAAT